MSQVQLLVTITADDAEWAEEYGWDTRAEAADDFRDHFTQLAALDAVQASVRDLTGGPVTVTVTAALPREQ